MEDFQDGYTDGHRAGLVRGVFIGLGIAACIVAVPKVAQLLGDLF